MADIPDIFFFFFFLGGGGGGGVNSRNLRIKRDYSHPLGQVRQVTSHEYVCFPVSPFNY